MKDNENHLSITNEVKQISLTETFQKMLHACNNCNPLSLSECISGCRIWRSKNQLRELYRKTRNPNFTIEIFNVLKNKRRAQTLRTLSKSYYSLQQLQRELNNFGYSLGQEALMKEYVTPLLNMELVEETSGEYHTTIFGNRISELNGGFPDIGNFLPAHSECHEENVLNILANESSTYQKLKEKTKAKNVARILKRLKEYKLVEPSSAKEHVFFFRTKRNPTQEVLSLMERRIYENIPVDGISAKKLAGKTNISIRRTYAYLRRLKGKKLVFTRERPTSYALTSQGFQLALQLRTVQELITEASMIAAKMSEGPEAPRLLQPSIARLQIQAGSFFKPQ